MRRWENCLPASLLPIWVLNLSIPPSHHGGIAPSPPQDWALLPHFQGQDIPKVADIWILTCFLWLHIKQVMLPYCPVPVLISLVGPVSFPRLPPWVSLHAPCHMAHFSLLKALANGLLWDKWLRPYHPIIDLFPSACSCECCPTQNLPCHWEGSTTRTHVLERFFIWDHLSELSAGIVLCYCCALPGHHALPPAWTSSSHSYNQISSRRPPFLALKQPHLSHPAALPDHVQKNPDMRCSTL